MAPTTNMNAGHPSSGAPGEVVDDGDKRIAYPRIKHELGQSMFHLLEPNGMEIDVKRSFAPCPNAPMLLAKLSFFALTLVSVLIEDFVYFENAYFSLAYLTHWGLIFTLFYQALSIFVMVKFSRGAPPNEDFSNNIDEQLVDWPIRGLWCLFSVSSTLDVVVFLGYWPLFISGKIMGIVKQSLTFINVMTHGVVAVLVLIDGLCLNRTPVRISQIVFPTIVGVIYALWTLIHWKLGIGNPEDEDSDWIYPSLDYENNTFFAFAQITVLAIVLVPLVFLSIRMMSLWSGGFKFDGRWRRTSQRTGETTLGDTTTRETTLGDTTTREYTLNLDTEGPVSAGNNCDAECPSPGGHGV